MRMTPPAKPGELFFGGSGEPRHLIRRCGEPSPQGEGKGLGVSMRGNFQNVGNYKEFVTGNGGFRGKC